MLLEILLGGSDGECARWLENAARVLEYVFDRSAHGVGVDQHEFVDERPRDAKRLLPNLSRGRTVGEQAHVRERLALTCANGAHHRVRIDGLHADHAHLWAHRFEVSGDPRNQSAAPMGTKTASIGPWC